MNSVRALVLQDPRHHHDPDGGRAIASCLQSAAIDAVLSEDTSEVGRLSANGFDVLVLYTQGDTFDPLQVTEMRNFACTGHGILGIHSATATNKTDDQYAKLIGSRFIGHGPVSDFTVKVSNPDHPIVKGIDDFSVTDELYVLQSFDKLDVFLTALWQDHEQPLGYAKTEGAGRVVYLAPGHDQRSLNSPTVKHLIVRAAHYAAGHPSLD